MGAGTLNAQLLNASLLVSLLRSWPMILRSWLTFLVTFWLTTMLILLWNMCDGERTLSPLPI